jgi:hypothetical protein
MDIEPKVDYTVFRLCSKLRKAIDSAKASVEDFKNISASADLKVKEIWLKEELDAQNNRDGDDKAMDIFDLKVAKGWWVFLFVRYIYSGPLCSSGPSKAEVHLNLLEEEAAAGGRKGSTAVLAQGLRIEEAQ